jgi:flagellar basal body-associated protein FliL
MLKIELNKYIKNALKVKIYQKLLWIFILLAILLLKLSIATILVVLSEKEKWEEGPRNIMGMVV